MNNVIIHSHWFPCKNPDEFEITDTSIFILHAYRKVYTPQFLLVQLVYKIYISGQFHQSWNITDIRFTFDKVPVMLKS